MDRTIMLVDDEKMITVILSNLIKLSIGCKVITYNDPYAALESEELKTGSVDIIISDFLMPGMNGLEFLKKTREMDKNIVLIMLTGYADKENAIRSINEVGLYHYIEKPWDNNEIISIINNALEKKNLEDDIKCKNSEVLEAKEEIERLYSLLKVDYENEVENVRNVIVTLANMIEAKDKYTDGHTRRVGAISRSIGERIGLEPHRLNMLEIAAIIHDIGKIATPENILLKPGKLTKEEFDIMKKHAAEGEKIIKSLNSLRDCLDPIRHHHEKLNGTGYPDGLKKDEISVEARIVAIADIFDALYSDRPYRARMKLNDVMSIMIKEAEEGLIDQEISSTLFEMIEKENLLQKIY